MAMIPYAPNKRSRNGSYIYGGGDAMQIVPTYQPRAVVPYTGYQSRNNMLATRRYSRRRRSRFNQISTYANPVYPRPEVKFHDTTIGNIGTGNAISIPAVPVAANVAVLNDIPQGASTTTRVGCQIAVKSVYYQFVLNFGTGAVPNVIRHILFWDRQMNGVAPDPSDLLQSQPYVTSALKLMNRERFVILADDRTTLSPQGDMTRIINGFRSINQKTIFPDTGTTNPTTGGLCVFFVSDETDVNSQPNYFGLWRCRYIDN